MRENGTTLIFRHGMPCLYGSGINQRDDMRTVNGGLFEYNPHSSRLKGYDYTHPGAYFVTICTYARICFFGEIKEGMMFLNKCGEIVHSCWHEIPQHFPHVQSAPFVVMPNHIHGIITIPKRLSSASPHVETRHAVSKTNVTRSTREAFQKPVPNSLPTIIRSFKSAVTKKLNESGEYLPATIWQRNYYEHVIRNEKELNQAIEYINFNPVKWEMDNDNPSALRRIKWTRRTYHATLIQCLNLRFRICADFVECRLIYGIPYE